MLRLSFSAFCHRRFDSYYCFVASQSVENCILVAEAWSTEVSSDPNHNIIRTMLQNTLEQDLYRMLGVGTKHKLGKISEWRTVAREDPRPAKQFMRWTAAGMGQSGRGGTKKARSLNSLKCRIGTFLWKRPRKRWAFSVRRNALCCGTTSKTRPRVTPPHWTRNYRQQATHQCSHKQ